MLSDYCSFKEMFICTCDESLNYFTACIDIICLLHKLFWLKYLLLMLDMPVNIKQLNQILRFFLYFSILYLSFFFLYQLANIRRKSFCVQQSYINNIKIPS